MIAKYDLLETVRKKTGLKFDSEGFHHRVCAPRNGDTSAPT